jgi:hypothetical protein
MVTVLYRSVNTGFRVQGYTAEQILRSGDLRRM